MSKLDKEKWDKKYIDKAQLLKQRYPSKNLVLFTNECKGVKALDIGCGAGRNALYLAKNGFEVDALDIAKVALDKLNEYAKEDKTDKLIHTLHVDIDDVSLHVESYDLVVMANFLDRDMIQKAKVALKKDGIFFVETYMKDDINEKENSKDKNLLKANELKEIFADYEILFYDEFENESHEIYVMKKQVVVARKL
jgi:2-polyprenyl-3-methyl-5-hydroxy-6-metoxy-1,4-benzoquinol methylase